MNVHINVPTPLDREPVEALALRFLNAIREHYLTRPTQRSTAQEMLNALAVVSAIGIYGTGSDESRAEAREFFNRAFNDQLSDLAESSP